MDEVREVWTELPSLLPLRPPPGKVEVIDHFLLPLGYKYDITHMSNIFMVAHHWEKKGELFNQMAVQMMH